jgi:hypothetical protein
MASRLPAPACPGYLYPPRRVTERNLPGYAVRGECSECGKDCALNLDGGVRWHKPRGDRAK